jgi:hypothetical protein
VESLSEKTGFLVLSGTTQFALRARFVAFLEKTLHHSMRGFLFYVLTSLFVVRYSKLKEC